MPLTPATRVGPYEIVSPLGAGGMGEVYRAKDSRLGREVAIKVLPFEFARDAARLRRFEQEARALGALNHPNIVAVYDIGMHEDSPYVASELLEGESLRDTLLRGKPPIRKVVDIAKQIACGLAGASAKGIVHRDLKPDNIFVLSDGRVKILDFGLAKQTLAGSFSAPGDADSAETVALGTSPGVVMGTVGYMSPEQVRGQPTDHRSDIFSFGCVLYETLTCERAFRGTSPVDVMSAILRDDARPAAELNPQTPAALDSILRRCLEKNPDRRFQSASDLAFALESLASNATEILPGVRDQDKVKSAPGRKRLYQALAAVLAAAALIGDGYFAHRNATPVSFAQFRRLTFRQGSVVNARFTGDGKGLAYDAGWDGDSNHIFSSTLGIPEARELDLPRGSSLVSVSSRGELALTLGPWNMQDGGLLGRSSLAGGPPREVLERVVYSDWQPDGLALAVVRRNGPQWRIEYPIGKSLYRTANLVLGMRLSPDGERVAFVELVQNEALLSTVDSAGEKRVLASIGKGTFYCPALSWSRNGKEIWFSSFDTEKAGIMFAIGLDGKRRTVATLPGQNRLFDISREGKMLLATSNQRLGILFGAQGEASERDLSWLETTLLSNLSADGRTIVFSEIGEGGGHNRSIYRRSTDGSPAVRLAEGIAGAVSPDGKWVAAYRANAKLKVTLVPSGPGEEIPIQVDGLEDRLGNVVAWLPDGRSYLVRGREPTRQGRLFLWDAAVRKLTPVSPEGTAFNDLLPAADGTRFLARGPDGIWNLYATDGKAPRPVRGIGAGERPVNWLADGQSVFISTTSDSAKSFPVFRLDLTTSRRTFWKEIRPAKSVDSVFNLRIAPDGKSYAYNYSRTLSDLYLVEGMR